MKDLYHVVYLLVKEHCVFFLSRCMYHAALRSFISLTFTFLVGYSFWVVEAQSFCASPRKLFRPAQHVVLQRRSNAALSAGTRIKWIQHSCPSRLYCSDWGGGGERNVIYSVLNSPQDPSWPLFATVSFGQVDLFPLWPCRSCLLPHSKAECTVTLQMHPSHELATCPTRFSLSVLSLFSAHQWLYLKRQA